MKRLALASMLCVALLGCGQKKMSGTDTFAALSFNGSGFGTTFNLQRNLTTIFFPAFQTTITDLRYQITNNTGGVATVQISEVPLNTPCPATAPAAYLLLLNVAAGTNVGYTSLGATTAASFTNLLYNDYTMCVYGTQGTSVAVFTVQFQADSSQTFSI